MKPLTVLKRSDQATAQVVAGEAILIHLASGTYYSLNAIGTEFWEMLDGQRTIADCAQRIADTYDVDRAMVVADLIELAVELTAEALLEEPDRP